MSSLFLPACSWSDRGVIFSNRVGDIVTVRFQFTGYQERLIGVIEKFWPLKINLVEGMFHVQFRVDCPWLSCGPELEPLLRAGLMHIRENPREGDDERMRAVESYIGRKFKSLYRVPHHVRLRDCGNGDDVVVERVP